MPATDDAWIDQTVQLGLQDEHNSWSVLKDLLIHRTGIEVVCKSLDAIVCTRRTLAGCHDNNREMNSFSISVLELYYRPLSIASTVEFSIVSCLTLKQDLLDWIPVHIWDLLFWVHWSETAVCGSQTRAVWIYVWTTWIFDIIIAFSRRLAWGLWAYLWQLSLWGPLCRMLHSSCVVHMRWPSMSRFQVLTCPSMLWAKASARWRAEWSICKWVCLVLGLY